MIDIKKYIILTLLLIFSYLMCFNIYQYNLSTVSIEVLSKYGSRGQETREIQTRLKNWGYYTGGVDGIYGSKTVAAVKYFQRKNGLTVDGIAGSQTLRALGINTASTTGTQNSNRNNDINLLARIISAEARGEPYSGQVAVGAVIMNRVEHPSFPNSISGVIYQPGAFTAITDGQFNQAIIASAYNAAEDALNGKDPTGGCIYYYNPATARSQWIFSLPVSVTIGKHSFSKGK